MHGGADLAKNDDFPSSSTVDGKKPFFIYLVTLLTVVGGFLFGYDTGVVSGAMILLKDTFQLDSTWQEIIVSATLAFAWIFSLGSGYLADFFGRKPVILMASFVFTVGGILMGISYNKYMLLGGRMIVGAGIGMVSMCVPMYISEVAPSDIRGSLVSLNQVFILLGMLASSIICGLFSYDKEDGWRYMLGLAAVPSLIQFIGFLVMPESPRWLIQKQKYDQAVSVLQRIRGAKANVEDEFQRIKDNCLEETREQGESSKLILWKVVKHPALRRALTLGCLLQTFQQICGINTVMYYSATIFQMAGIRDPSMAIWLTCITSGVSLVVCLGGVYFVERLGRRTLVLVSMAGVVISLAILAIGFQLSDFKTPHASFVDEDPDNDPCRFLSKCTDCVNNHNCGFCYVDSGTSVPYNATCSLVNPKMTENAMTGPCSIPDMKKPLLYAYNWCPTSMAWLIILGMVLYLIGFAPGMGPMPWTINSEIFPLWARSTCIAVTTSFNWLFNLVISMTFLTLTEEITKYGAFYLYTGLSILGWIVFFLMLPETKGKSLEEVESLFATSWFAPIRSSKPQPSDKTMDNPDVLPKDSYALPHYGKTNTATVGNPD